MAGILNSKERMIDFIVTPEGRRQMASGKMKIEFATLTDQHTFYTSSNLEGVADDASERLFFETFASTTDVITPEIESGGDSKGTNMMPFRAGSLKVEGRTFASGTYSTGSNLPKGVVLSGSSVLQKAPELTDAILKHFEGMRILGTEDVFSDSSDFILSALSGTFAITDIDLDLNEGKGIYLKDLSAQSDFPGANPEPDSVVNLDASPSIFSDKRFSHLPNYRYLPPRNIPKPRQPLSDPSLLLSNKYPDFTPASPYNFSSIESDLASRQRVSFEFVDTSRQNNIMTQIFEFDRSEGVDKLSIVDYGVELNEDDSDPKHIFFVGKILNDSRGSQTFMNIFTIVYDTVPREEE